MNSLIINPLKQVRDTTSRVTHNASHVAINRNAVQNVANDLIHKHHIDSLEWNDEEQHFDDASNSPELLLQYLLVLDTLNFCFWPSTINSTENQKSNDSSSSGFEYDTLASRLRTLVENDPHVFGADRLKSMNIKIFQEQWFPSLTNFPNIEERVRLLQEIGIVLSERFNGSAANLVRAADHSAVRLVRLITENFSGFRDSSIEPKTGRQVFFYKRAQIFVGDVWGAFNNNRSNNNNNNNNNNNEYDYGRFDDMNQLTMFADYRVPQILHHLGVMEYSEALSRIIAAREEIPANSQYEVEIRAVCIQAVEQIRDAINSLQQQKQEQQQEQQDKNQEDPPKFFHSFQVDWMLWQIGEKQRESTLLPHHRTRTIFY